MFSVIQGETVILVCKGLYRQSDVYVYANGLFAKYGAGFVRLTKAGTSKPDVRWEALSLSDYSADALGRLVLLA